ncbi:MAG: sugar ABC transporter substrate-binding protein [Candidatus Atribacteria bacterium]|nr:sugar ABC transporter substrate-binding protein [Candidatus Atribacteria bacterium]
MKKISLFLMIIVLLVSFSANVLAQKGTIAIAGWGQNNPFFVLLHDTAKKVFEEAGYEVIISDGETKIDKQSADMDNFIAMGVKGMLLTPVDSFALASAVTRVKDAGIPVVTGDMTVYNAPLNATVESDNFYAGYVVGDWMVKYYQRLEQSTDQKRSFKVVCGLFSQANSCRDRQEGFEKAISEGPAGLIEIVAKQEQKSVAVDEGYQFAQNIMTAYEDLDALFFGCNDNYALGALKAVQEAGKEDQVVVTGVDGQVEAVNAINAGTAFKCTGAQHPQVIGYVAALRLLDLLEGKEVPTYTKIICTPIHLPFQPFSLDPAEMVEAGKAISRTVDVKFPITEPVK